MPELGLLKNLTSRDQSWGSFEIPANSVGCVPLELAESLRARPVPGFEVLGEETDPPLVRRTPHQPWGLRYQKR